uniref:YqaJ viral recombinase domain-containing protein n=1 Tax=Magallana gigas TaxID=29159 RepID=A0A8W8KYC9_MAGGI
MSHLLTIPDDTSDVVMEEEVRTLEDPMETAMKGLILSAENLPMPVSIDDSLSLFIEKRTRGQRKCQIWKELRKGRITSYLFGAVLTSGPSPISLIKHVIHGSSLDRYPTLPVPVRWVVEHEQNALVDYLALQNAVSSLRVEESGLTIYQSHAFLGATSDGWVYDESVPEGNQKGVLEIKCPYSISNDVITHREVHKLVGKKGFCLEESENSPRLMRDHS